MVTDLCWVCGEALMLSGLSRAAVHVFLVQRYNNLLARCTILHDTARYCTILHVIARYCRVLQGIAVFVSFAVQRYNSFFARGAIRRDMERYGAIRRNKAHTAAKFLQLLQLLQLLHLGYVAKLYINIIKLCL